MPKIETGRKIPMRTRMTIYRAIWTAVLCLLLASPASTVEITIAATEWPPFTSRTLPGGGFFTDICQAALSDAGHRSKVVFLPWKRALRHTAQGKTQAVIGVGFTEARTADFIYPATCLEVPVHFFARKDNSVRFTEVRDLCPAALGVFLGSNYEQEMDAFDCFDIQPVPSVSQNILKLHLNRIDLFIESHQAVMFHLKNDHPALLNRIVPLNPPFRIERAYMVFTRKMKQADQIQRDFDRGMRQIKSRGLYDAILRRHSIKD